MAQQSVTGSGQPGLSTVPQEHAMGDMAPVRELPYGPAATSCTRGRTDGGSRLRTHLTKPLAPLGASTDGKRTCTGRLGSVNGGIDRVPSTLEYLPSSFGESLARHESRLFLLAGACSCRQFHGSCIPAPSGSYRFNELHVLQVGERR
jgi:hypothetical protein